jgi:predicted DNA-binding protein YlxM (UPF0122 family)
MGKKRIEIPESELRELYSVRHLSMSEIVKQFGCSKSTILLRIHSNGIPLRSPSERRALFDISESDLFELYIVQQLSIRQVAARYGCSYDAIRDRLLATGIPPRSFSQAQLVYAKIYDELRVFKVICRRKRIFWGSGRVT